MDFFSKPVFFDSWEAVIRVGIVGVLAYIYLVFLLKISGKRTLSKMNAFDFIITVAYGSVFANLLLNSKVTILEGLFALTLLTLMQYSIAFLCARFPGFSNFVKSKPSILFYKGNFIKERLLKERFIEEEIYTAMREQGFTDAGDVYAVILETEGSLSVLGRKNQIEEDVLQASHIDIPAINKLAS